MHRVYCVREFIWTWAGHSVERIIVCYGRGLICEMIIAVYG
jgi:hypothetical protein